MSTTHELKSWPDYFEPIFNGNKTFDIRKNDRAFKVGDYVLLREWNDQTSGYTGREIRKRISYILHGVGPGAILPMIGLLRGYVILSLQSAGE